MNHLSRTETDVRTMLVLCAPFFLKTDITAKKDAIEETMSRGLASGPDAWVVTGQVSFRDVPATVITNPLGRSMADVSAGAPAVRCYRFSDGSFAEPTVQMGIAPYRFGGPDQPGSPSDNWSLRDTYDRMVKSAGGDYCAAAIGEDWPDEPDF